MSNSDPANSTSNPPPIPARPCNATWNQGYMRPTSFNNYGGLGGLGGYGGYGSYGGYGGYSGMGGYGSYGAYGGYNGLGSMDSMAGYGSAVGDFFRNAEQTWIQSFQPLQYMVQSLTSITVMLESTYFAINSSGRAILGLANHISSLRNQLSQIFSQLPLIPFIFKLLKRLLYFLGLIATRDLHEEAWKQASSNVLNNSTTQATLNTLVPRDISRSSLSSILFFGLIFGTPWMIWKLFQKLSPQPVNTEWKTGKDEHYVAQALYTFTTHSPQELGFNVGQKLIIAPKEVQPNIGDWLLASVDGKTGLVPANYVKIVEHKPKTDAVDQQKL